MVKITICDKCKAEKGKVVQTIRFTKVPKHPELRIDLCDECMATVSKLQVKDYIVLAYKLTMNMDLEKDLGMRKLVFAQLHIVE